MKCLQHDSSHTRSVYISTRTTQFHRHIHAYQSRLVSTFAIFVAQVTHELFPPLRSCTQASTYALLSMNIPFAYTHEHTYKLLTHANIPSVSGFFHTVFAVAQDRRLARIPLPANLFQFDPPDLQLWGMKHTAVRPPDSEDSEHTFSSTAHAECRDLFSGCSEVVCSKWHYALDVCITPCMHSLIESVFIRLYPQKLSYNILYNSFFAHHIIHWTFHCKAMSAIMANQ